MLGLASGGVHAAGIDLALGNETANLQILLNPRQLFESGGTEMAIGGFINEESDLIGNLTLLASGLNQTQDAQYRLGAGIKAIVGDIDVDNNVTGRDDNQTVAAVGLGLQLGLLVSASPTNPLEFVVEGYFAPKITSFADAESFSEFSARLQLDIIPQAAAYVGYRRMRADTDDFNDLDLDSSAHAGIRILF